MIERSLASYYYFSTTRRGFTVIARGLASYHYYSATTARVGRAGVVGDWVGCSGGVGGGVGVVVVVGVVCVVGVV